MWTLADTISPPAADRDLPPDDPGGAEELIIDHLGLADLIARRFGHRGEEADDLRQVARTGLVEAARRFDASRGAFAPFAAATVTGAIKRQFRDHGWLVRPPRHTQEMVISVRQAWSELAQRIRSRGR